MNPEHADEGDVVKKIINSGMIVRILLTITLLFQIYVSLFHFFRYDEIEMRKIGDLLNNLLLIVASCWMLFQYFQKKQKEQFIKGFRQFVNINNVTLVLFFVWLVFVCYRRMFLIQGDSLESNEQTIIITAIHIFLAYFYAQCMDGEIKYVRAFLHLMTTVFSLLMVAVLSGLIMDGEFYLWNRNLFLEINAGFDSVKPLGRLEINCNPNVVGMFVKTIMMLCLYLFFATKNIYRFFYILAYAVNYIVLALTGCRAGMLGVCIGTAMVFAIYAWEKTVKSKTSLRILIAAVTIVICSVALDSLRQPTVKGYIHLRAFVTGEELTASDKRPLLSNLSQREKIYFAALSSMRHPEIAAFGVTPSEIASLIDVEIVRFGVMPLEERFYPDGTPMEHIYQHTHNEFFEIMCATGLPGLTLFLVWLCTTGWGGAAVYFDFRGHFRLEEKVLMVVCLAELINNMLEPWLTFRYNLSGMIFYLTAGYAVVFAQRLKHSGEEGVSH